MLVQCMNLKKIRKVFTSKFVGTGPSSYEKRIYWAVVSQGLRNTGLRESIKKFSQYNQQISGPKFDVMTYKTQSTSAPILYPLAQ